MTKSTAIILAFVCVGLSALAQVSMKWGMSGLDNTQGIWPTYWQAIRSGWVHLGLFLYGASAIIWLIVLTKLDISLVYPMVSLGFIFTILAGVFLLSEPFSLVRALAFFLIIAGVILLAFDS